MTELNGDHTREKTGCTEKVRSHNINRDLTQAGMTGGNSELEVVQKGLEEEVASGDTSGSEGETKERLVKRC